MKVRVIVSHSLGGGREVFEGDVIELADNIARGRIHAGLVEQYVEVASPEAPPVPAASPTPSTEPVVTTQSTEGAPAPEAPAPAPAPASTTPPAEPKPVKPGKEK